MYRQFYEVLWLLKEWGKSAFRHYRGFTSMHHLERHTAWERHCDKWVFSLVTLGCHIQHMWFQFVDNFPVILERFIRVQNLLENHFLKMYFYWNTCYSVYKTLFISSFMWTHLAFLIFASFEAIQLTATCAHIIPWKMDFEGLCYAIQNRKLCCKLLNPSIVLISNGVYDAWK